MRRVAPTAGFVASVRALVVAAVVLIPALGRAADPQPYTVEIAETGHSDVDAAIAASSLLASLRESAPAPPFALIERARGDADRIQIALQSFGYYGATVNVTIDGHAVSDPDLPNVLDRVAQGTAVAVKVAIEPGPQYTLRDIHIDGSLPNDDAGALGLPPGEPAIAADVLAAQTRLLTALQEDGYAYAKVDPPIAYLDHDARAVDLDFKVETGPRAVVGPIAIRGALDVNEDFIRGAITVHPGDQYKPSDIEKARQALVNLGVFSGVSVRAAEQPVADSEVPLTFDVQERPMHAVNLSVSYSTDLGGGASAGWTHRNLFGNAEQLNLSPRRSRASAATPPTVWATARRPPSSSRAFSNPTRRSRPTWPPSIRTSTPITSAPRPWAFSCAANISPNGR